MSIQKQLHEAKELASAGQHLQAAKLFENVATKMLRTGNEEKQNSSANIFAKSIAHYLLAEKENEARNLAFQVQFMKESDPFLALQVESAICPTHQLVRTFYIDSFPDSSRDISEFQKDIPNNHKIMQIQESIIIKFHWQKNIFGLWERKYSLHNQEFDSPKKFINYALSTQRGIHLFAVETASGEKILIQIAVTFNKNPVDILQIV
ncbi:MAG: hypothetical protein U9O98_11355 [Asgard group archaeon]|nr:hypothetical protein [Asgard group archaeon]